MMLRRMKLENIRSYKKETIDFQEGVLLFQGDIGSGKSSILLGLEFVLFGAINQGFYDKITRHDSTGASVELDFTVDRTDYTAYRSIKRTSNGMKPDKSYLVSGDVKTELSPEEMREKILSLLRLREKSRGKVETFHMSIFTPQEQMNSILSMRDEERLEAVRKIFNLEEYKRAVDNISVIKKGLEKEILRLITRAERIEEYREKHEEKTKELKLENEEKKYTVKELEEKTATLEDIVARKKELEELRDVKNKTQSQSERFKSLAESLQENIDDIDKELEDISKGEKELDDIRENFEEYVEVVEKVGAMREGIQERMDKERRLETLQVEHKNLTEKLERLNSQEEAVHKIILEIEKLEKETEGSEETKKRKEDMRSEITDLKGDLRTAQNEIKALEEEKEEMAGLEGQGECSKCKQPISEEHIDNILKELESKKAKKKEKEVELIERLETKRKEHRTLTEAVECMEKLERNIGYRKKEKQRLEKEIKSLPDIQDKVESTEKKMVELKDMIGEFEHSKEDLQTLEKRKIELRKYRDRKLQLEEKIAKKDELVKKKEDKEGKLEDTEKKLADIEKKLMELKEKFSQEEFLKLKGEYEGLIKETSKLKEKQNYHNSTIKRLDKEIEALERELKKMERCKVRASELNSMQTWITRDLKECIRSMEEHRMAQLNMDFESYFRAWFDEILDDPEINATLDENFAPVITVQNHVTSVDDISGGERTSVALAYRLAFNTMIKKELELESNLLVLDEPTTGFSREQLRRLKDVMAKVTADQIVIVSHENEIVNLADVEYLVKKEDGVSRVEQASSI